MTKYWLGLIYKDIRCMNYILKYIAFTNNKLINVMNLVFEVPHSSGVCSFFVCVEKKKNYVNL